MSKEHRAASSTKNNTRRNYWASYLEGSWNSKHSVEASRIGRCNRKTYNFFQQLQYAASGGDSSSCLALRWTSWKAISTAEVNDWALENKVVEKSNLGLRLSVEDDSAICPRGGVRHWNVVEEEAAADYANNSGVDPWPCIQHSQRSSSPVLIPIEAILSKK